MSNFNVDDEIETTWLSPRDELVHGVTVTIFAVTPVVKARGLTFCGMQPWNDDTVHVTGDGDITCEDCLDPEGDDDDGESWRIPAPRTVLEPA